MALYKYCSCGELINYNSNICNECKKKRNKDKYEYEQSNYKRLYHTKRWQRLRRNIMAEYNWLCLVSLSQGKIIEAKILHHIEEANEDNFFNRDNLIPLSHAVHEDIHRKYEESEYSRKECKEWLRSLKDTPLPNKM